MANEAHVTVAEVTAAEVLKQIVQRRPEVDFERLYPGRTVSFSSQLATQYKTLQSFNVDEVSEALYGSACILWKGLNTLVSAVEILRKGYLVEPLILSRHALECCCVAFDVYKNPAQLSKIYAERYKPARAIQVVKTILPQTRKLYDHLSETMVHAGIMSTFPQWVYEGGAVKAVLVGGGFDETNPELFEISLSGLQLVIDACSAIEEFIFFDYVTDHQFWERRGARMRYHPSKTTVTRALSCLTRLQRTTQPKKRS